MPVPVTPLGPLNLMAVSLARLLNPVTSQVRVMSSPRALEPLTRIVAVTFGANEIRVRVIYKQYSFLHTIATLGVGHQNGRGTRLETLPLDDYEVNWSLS